MPRARRVRRARTLHAVSAPSVSPCYGVWPLRHHPMASVCHAVTVPHHLGAGGRHTAPAVRHVLFVLRASQTAHVRRQQCYGACVRARVACMGSGWSVSAAVDIAGYPPPTFLSRCTLRRHVVCCMLLVAGCMLSAVAHKIGCRSRHGYVAHPPVRCAERERVGLRRFARLIGVPCKQRILWHKPRGVWQNTPQHDPQRQGGDISGAGGGARTTAHCEYP